MNLILKKLLDNAKEKKENNSSPPLFINIQAENQDRPLPKYLMEQQDIPYGEQDSDPLFADVVYPKERGEELLPVFVFVHGGALVTGDRKSNRVFCQEIARQGFVVYSVEYRLIDRADAFGMVSDICRALKLVRNTLGRFGGDPDRVSLCGESAGAFMSLYAAAAGRSKTLYRMFGCGRYGLSISRLILISGMIYTARPGIVGAVFKDSLYGERKRDRRFMKFILPDNPRIISSLPPVLLISSKADFLKNHSLDFAGALKKNNHEIKLLYYPEGKELTHAFPSLIPSLPESREVISGICDWIRG